MSMNKQNRVVTESPLDLLQVQINEALLALESDRIPYPMKISKRDRELGRLAGLMEAFEILKRGKL